MEWRVGCALVDEGWDLRPVTVSNGITVVDTSTCGCVTVVITVTVGDPFLATHSVTNSVSISPEVQVHEIGIWGVLCVLWRWHPNTDGGVCSHPRT